MIKMNSTSMISMWKYPQTGFCNTMKFACVVVSFHTVVEFETVVVELVSIVLKVMFCPVLARNAAAIIPGIRYIARMILDARVFGISFTVDMISIERENSSMNP